MCDSPACVQLCNSGNCSLECHGLNCQQNCTGGGCNLTCFTDADTCKQHCPANNCTISRIQRTKQKNVVFFKASPGAHEVTTDDVRTSNGRRRLWENLLGVKILCIIVISFIY